jgi:kumamolisin
MKRFQWCLSGVVALLSFSFSPAALAQVHVMTPQSSLPQPRNANGDVMARTNVHILIPSTGQMNFGASVQPSELPPVPGYLYETPASLGCIYNLVAFAIPGCNPNVTTQNHSGGSRAIAIVDAYDDPTAASDLDIFSAQFGLPPANFHVIYAQGREPGQDPTGGWEVEEALDTQWSHAMAPAAEIYLVEAEDNSFTHLFEAVNVASGLIAAAGGGEVSMGWGAREFSEEISFDSYFTKPGVVYLAAAGDSPGVYYPSASPNVISAGGTSISRDLYTGNFVLENSWQEVSGGPSQFEPRPRFQDGVSLVVGSARGTPDLSLDGNPSSGVWVYNTNAVLGIGWYVVGGTSVGAPSLSGIINSAGRFLPSSQAENQLIYSNRSNAFDFRDITYGTCGIYIGYFASPGYDFCSGVGTDQGLHGK